MTPGSVLDAELTRINRAAGVLCTMVVKRRIVRAALTEALDAIEAACRVLRGLL